MSRHKHSDSTERITLARRVALEIRESILRGETPRGEPLRQVEIAARFGVSRIPLREALAQLEAEGFVSNSPYVGAIVTPLSAEEAVDLVDIVVALEQRALLLAIPNQTPEDCDNADAARLRLNAALARGDIDGARDEQIMLCRILNLPCGRTRLVNLIDSYRLRMSRYLRVLAETSTSPLTARFGYRAFIDACRRKDVETALCLDEEIYRTALSLVLDALRRSESGAYGNRGNAASPATSGRRYVPSTDAVPRGVAADRSMIQTASHTPANTAEE
jgi:DNA-binding GntR family transcriptional regulator